MPIKRRDTVVVRQTVPEPKPEQPFVPSKDAVLDHLNTDSPAIKRRVSVIVHGGRDPKTIPVDDMISAIRSHDYGKDSPYPSGTAARNRVKNRLTAIRSYCVDNCETAHEVKTCTAITCAFWPFRMGGNPFNRRK